MLFPCCFRVRIRIVCIYRIYIQVGDSVCVVPRHSFMYDVAWHVRAQKFKFCITHMRETSTLCHVTDLDLRPADHYNLRKPKKERKKKNMKRIGGRFLCNIMKSWCKAKFKKRRKGKGSTRNEQMAGFRVSAALHTGILCATEWLCLAFWTLPRFIDSIFKIPEWRSPSVQVAEGTANRGPGMDHQSSVSPLVYSTVHWVTDQTLQRVHVQYITSTPKKIFLLLLFLILPPT